MCTGQAHATSTDNAGELLSYLIFVVFLVLHMCSQSLIVWISHEYNADYWEEQASAACTGKPLLSTATHLECTVT